MFFIIKRYLEESHELNEGVQWRLTVPDLDLLTSASNCEAPVSPETLHFTFELYCCPLLRDETIDMMYEVDYLIPPDVRFERVATQSIEIPRAASGVHVYCPIRFDSRHFIELDAMLHVGVTGIKYSPRTFEHIYSGESTTMYVYSLDHWIVL